MLMRVLFQRLLELLQIRLLHSEVLQDHRRLRWEDRGVVGPSEEGRILRDAVKRCLRVFRLLEELVRNPRAEVDQRRLLALR